MFLAKNIFESVHEIQKIFRPKDFFWSIMKMTLTKNITNMSQGPPNLGFRSVKVQNWDYFFDVHIVYVQDQDFENFLEKR